MKENKKEQPTMAPRLRFPDFRKSGEWRGEALAKFLNESRIEGSSGDIARKITVKLWGNGVYAKEESIKGSENTKYYKRRAGQFIYSKLDFLNQAFGIVPPDLEGYESTVDLPCFDVSKDLNTSFLLEWVKRDDFYKRNGEIADGGRKAKRIQSEVFLSFPIALPPHIAEQNRIADCLSSLDELITAECQKLGKLRVHRAVLTQQILPRKGESAPALRFPEFRKRGAWQSKTLAEIATIRSGSTPSRAEPAFYNGGTIPWVKTTDLNNGFIVRTEECVTPAAKVKVNPAGSVLVAMYGGFKQIGRTGYLTMPAATNQAISVLNADENEVLPIYLLTWMNARVGDWKGIASSSRKDPNITGTDVANFTITYPDKDEQQRIADAVASVNDGIEAQTQKIASLKAHRTGLLQQLFPMMDEVHA